MMYTNIAARGRRMVLVDIENIVGGGIYMASQVHLAQVAIDAAIDIRPDDQVVVACGRLSADIVGFEWVGVHRLKFRGGIDGADKELLEILETECVETRFSEIVLVSGDGIFADAVSRLARNRDLAVTVATRPEACSHRLRMAAPTVLNIDVEQNVLLEAA